VSASCVSDELCEFYRRLADPATIERSGQFIARNDLDLPEVAAACGELLVTSAAFSDQWFDLADDDGEPAVVIKVLDEDAETVVDLAAWPIASPDRVHMMFGRSPMLGLAAAVNPSTYFLDRPLRIFRSALDWLRAGGIGCVIINEFASARILLDAPGLYAGENEAHANELRRISAQLVDPSKILFPKAL